VVFLLAGVSEDDVFSFSTKKDYLLNFSFGCAVELLVQLDHFSDNVIVIVGLDSVVESNSWQVGLPEINSVSDGLHVKDVEGVFLSSGNDVLCLVICLVLIRLLDVASVIHG